MVLANIDTDDFFLNEDYERQKRILESEKGRENYKYTANDLALVRVTDHLPNNDKYLVPLNKVPFILELAAHPGETAINRILQNELLEKKKKEQMDKDDKVELTMQEYKEISSMSNILPLSTQYRSTVHFSLNGMVGSHSRGNWESDEQDIIIIEPFSKHENDKNIVNVNGQDTFFKNGIQLSDDGVLLIGEKRADEVLDLGLDKDFDIIFYKGDKKTAINMCLVCTFGVVPENIGSEYILRSSTSDKVKEFINSKEYNQGSHLNSMSYLDDDIFNLKLWALYDNDFLNYLSNELSFSPEFTSKIEFLKSRIPSEAFESVQPDIPMTLEQQNAIYSKRALISTSYDEDTVNVYKNIIEKIGIDNYKNIVDKYNNALTEAVKTGKYPTNDEILSGAKFGYNVELDMISDFSIK